MKTIEGLPLEPFKLQGTLPLRIPSKLLALLVSFLVFQCNATQFSLGSAAQMQLIQIIYLQTKQPNLYVIYNIPWHSCCFYDVYSPNSIHQEIKQITHLHTSQTSIHSNPLSQSSTVITPSTQLSPPTSPLDFALTQTSNDTATPSTQQSTNLMPIKGFVHEVLHRSHTSGSMLQTTLYYLEAIHAKVPELVQKEKNGDGVHGEDLLTFP